MQKIKVGIVGYGNLGKAAELAVQQNPDIELVAIFTRRNPLHITSRYAKAEPLTAAQDYKGKIDVMLLCGGSATDLPEQTPYFANYFNTVDSFDTHAKIPEHKTRVQAVAEKAGTLALISTGWDPGMFSLMRILFATILPQGHSTTFWGRGVSQGHSDAIRRVAGVKNGVQYTIPLAEAIDMVRQGGGKNLTSAQKHVRQCYVVPEDGADRNAIERAIKNMPNYFADYHTEVHFISETELKEKHSRLPHGGFVFRNGETGDHNQHIAEFSIRLDSNPEFTAGILMAYARAVFRLSKKGVHGVKTVFDIAPSYLSPLSAEDMLKEL